ncbi:MAG: hypothetical protein IJ662_00555 [Clostridia bacterium]|nr:hypothetical protein [Clostridia bacterium]
MIRKLKIRLTALVMAGLLLASGILVLAINWMNAQSLARQARDVLEMLAENDGQRPTLRDREKRGNYPGNRSGGTALQDRLEGTMAPGRPEGTLPPAMPGGRMGGQFSREIRNAADFSNYYLVYLNDDGTVKSWESDRAELYTDEQVSAFAAEVLRRGDTSGRVGDAFFRRRDDLLIVVDATVDMQNARSFLRTTLLVAVVQWAVLSAGAAALIHRMVKPVDEAMEKQKQFVWDASHELKTPLAVISANAEALAGEMGDHPSLQYIRSEVQRTDHLVQSLLTQARLEKGSAPVAQEKFDLSRALLSVALPFESAVYEAGKTIEMDIPEGVVCTGNEEMIQQLTMILLSNAVKYSDAGGRIALSLESRGDKRLIRVHNSGPAIPAAEQEKIFDRFYRVDSSHNRETPGNGLGLAIAKNIVEIHRGRIAVQSEEGKGTTFTVTL